MAEKTTLVIAAVVGAFAGTFLTRYMVSGHQDHLVEVLMAQFIGNGLLAAILVTLLVGKVRFSAEVDIGPPKFAHRWDLGPIRLTPGIARQVYPVHSMSTEDCHVL
ncbi:MAG: hypothetical protein WA725_22195 [Pseudolabrys sp.]